MGNKLFKSNSAYNESPAAATPPIHSGGILDVICNQKDGTIVTASEDKSICMFKSYECMKSYATMKKTYLKGHMKTVNRVCLGGNKVFSASRDLSIRIWDMNNQEISNVIEDCHSLNISAISATKDGSFCASGSRDYSVKVRNVEMGKVIQEYSTPRNVVTFLKYDESDTLLYQGSEDLCMRVYDTRSSSRMPSKELPGYIYFPISIDIHHNGNYLITGSKGFNTTGGGEVKLWDLRTNKTVKEFSKHSFDVTGCKFSGDYSISVSKDGSLGYWNILGDDGGTLTHIPGANLLTAVDIIDIRDEGVRIVSSSFDGSLSFLQINSPADIKTLFTSPSY